MSAAIKRLLIDIEGTVSSISFVKQVLFPYARDRFADFIRLQADAEQRQVILQQVRDFAEQPTLNEQQVIDQLVSWSDEDRKIAPLKDLQGLVWAQGYANGELKVELYGDVLPYLTAWRDAGYQLYIYSSGSVLAQKLLFGHTTQGDVNALFSGYFDTGIGNKLQATSYQTIAAELSSEPQHILFLSDHFGELNAASDAGLQVIGLDRGEVSFPADFRHRVVADFKEIAL